ncbi:MAG: carboxylating nicotinate-nucleotide diphosphorylase [Bacteroidetes bacterium]|nr:carboxylating nicotinate-nucleotide diphosphorylase [Bacteroidota bacterium]MCW5895346.1 carboxylating nicotinate-nucleotide diphosphorylase [Bacteroidota bacterium]
MTHSILHDSRVSRLIELALMEDIGMGDVTSDAIISESQLGRADLLCKEDGIVAGLEVAALVFQYCDHSITLQQLVPDGEIARKGQSIAAIDGSTRSILKGERTALNFLQRMSGIATTTHKYVHAVAGTRAKVIDTRKTAPGLRVLDKWAVRLGGGFNHRFGLDDMVLIKDNHIVAAGGITKAVEMCRTYLQAEGIDVAIEVETKKMDEVREALQCTGIQRIMLDNFPLDQMQKAVELVARKVEVEASGGVTLQTVRSIAETGVDFISVGALTHSVKGLDISLELHHVQ